MKIDPNIMKKVTERERKHQLKKDYDKNLQKCMKVHICPICGGKLIITMPEIGGTRNSWVTTQVATCQDCGYKNQESFLDPSW